MRRRTKRIPFQFHSLSYESENLMTDSMCGRQQLLRGDKKAKMNNCNNDIIDGSAVPYSREPELEAIISEINVADFQSHRLKKVLGDKVAGYMHLGGGYYRKNMKDTFTESVFYHRGKLYRLSMSVREMPSRKEPAHDSTAEFIELPRNDILRWFWQEIELV